LSLQVKEWPDPLTFSDGCPVQTASDWLGPRRAELRSLFERYMYGAAPDASAATAHVESSSPWAEGTLERWEVRIASESGPKVLRLLIALPDSGAPVPAIVALNFHGNHTVIQDASIPLPVHWVMESSFSDGNLAAEKGRGGEALDWSVEDALKSGFALVTACYCEIEPDDPNQTSEGAISTWAWGLSRIMDVLLEDARFDSNRIGVTGHSRLGKTALLAAAFDERFAFCAPVQSGCGGAAPSRGVVGESVEQITNRFPHWFSPEFASFAGCENDLPFDQHELLAMVAPRPLLVANASGDLWANPEGQAEALRQAERVYTFLGASDRTFEFLRPGGHQMGREDWDTVRRFAQGTLGKAS